MARINSIFSTLWPIWHKVPQGSMLGPLLFLIYINYVFDTITDTSELIIYADDCTAWKIQQNGIDRVRFLWTLLRQKLLFLASLLSSADSWWIESESILLQWKLFLSSRFWVLFVCQTPSLVISIWFPPNSAHLLACCIGPANSWSGNGSWLCITLFFPIL